MPNHGSVSRNFPVVSFRSDADTPAKPESSLESREGLVPFRSMKLESLRIFVAAVLVVVVVKSVAAAIAEDKSIYN